MHSTDQSLAERFKALKDRMDTLNNRKENAAPNLSDPLRPSTKK